MSDRAYFKQRAAGERAAAQAAKDETSFRAHMELAREFDWRAVTEPMPEFDNMGQVSGPSIRATRPHVVDEARRLTQQG